MTHEIDIFKTVYHDEFKYGKITAVSSHGLLKVEFDNSTHFVHASTIINLNREVIIAKMELIEKLISIGPTDEKVKLELYQMKSEIFRFTK